MDITDIPSVLSHQQSSPALKVAQEDPKILLRKKIITFFFQLNAILTILVLLGTNMMLNFLILSLRKDPVAFYEHKINNTSIDSDSLQVFIEENLKMADIMWWVFVADLCINFVLLISVLREFTWGYWPWVAVQLPYIGYLIYEVHSVYVNGNIHFGFREPLTVLCLNLYALVTISINQFLRLKWKKIFPADEEPQAVRHRRVSLTEMQELDPRIQKLSMSSSGRSTITTITSVPSFMLSRVPEETEPEEGESQSKSSDNVTNEEQSQKTSDEEK